VIQLIKDGKVVALGVDPETIRELQRENVNKMKEVIGVVGMMRENLERWIYLLNTGAGMGGHGSSNGVPGIPVIPADLDKLRQTFFAESLAARAA
jgi:hypothetical protein